MHIVAAAVICINGKFLMCRRGAGLHSFAWEFPCVELESDGTLEATLEEFLFVELGLNVAVKEILCRISMKLKMDYYVFYGFSVKVEGGKFSLGKYSNAALLRLKNNSKRKEAPYTQKMRVYLCDVAHKKGKNFF